MLHTLLSNIYLFKVLQYSSRGLYFLTKGGKPASFFISFIALYILYSPPSSLIKLKWSYGGSYFIVNGVTATTLGSGSHTYNGYLNFGQRPFAYAPPAGFKALCTKNLPTPSILNPSKHFDVKAYAGNGAANSAAQQVITVGFTPDFAWIKNRTSAGSNNVLVDVQRPVKSLISNDTSAEVANGNQALGTNYLRVAENGGAANIAYNPNLSGQAYVTWLWKAGGAPVTNNAGSTQSQVSANPQAGFSIVTYTGTGANATVGHGLPIKPKLVIIKNCSVGTTNWTILHTDLGNQGSYEYFLQFDTAAKQATTTAFPIGNWTSTTIPTGSNNNVNGNGNRMIAYCFAEIPGFSKIGSYTGNGSTDGPFVYCGFRPKFVMVKRVDAAGHWYIHDTTRSPNNPNYQALLANAAGAELSDPTNMPYDVLSNGFKCRQPGSSYEQNASGGTYIFYAVAEQPFQFANAR